MRCSCSASAVLIPMFCVLALAPARADAAVVFTTLDANGGFHPTLRESGAQVSIQEGASSGTGMSRHAAGFLVTGGDFRLESISLPICDEGTPGNLLRVGLLEDNDGVPGNVLEWLSDRQEWPVSAPSFTTLTTLPSAVHPILRAGSEYWIVTEIAAMPETTYAQKEYHWYRSLSGAQIPVWQHYQSYSLPYSDWNWDNWDEYLRFERLAFRVDGTQTVDVGAPALVTHLAPAAPTPFHGRTSLAYEIARPAAIEISVFSVTGARVRTLVNGEHAAGPGHVSWDGRDEHGRIAPAGLYIVRLEWAGTRFQQRLIKLD